MFVCQCNGVTDRQVRGAVLEGCTTVRSVAAATGAGTVCGTCIPTVRDLVCGSCPSRLVALQCDDLPTPVMDRPAHEPAVPVGLARPVQAAG